VPTNQAGYGLSATSQNQRDDKDDVGHTSRSNDLFYVKTNRVKVSQSDIKTAESMMTSDALASSLRLCED
jgi:hypothetical protein